ncbi:MAG: DUF1015 domain-containing protein [Bryobacteraceae bacterium]
MANIFPFHAYRYSLAAGDLANLLTQPYDKISSAMNARYLAASPYNLVRVILGEPSPGDNDSENVYTRSAAYFREWIANGVLARESESSLFAYFQEFTVPDSGERLTRKGFIGLGAVEPYEAGVVFRHERTLAGPKKDRRQVLEHTRAHFGQIFMLYPDPECAVDALLDAAAQGAPLAEVRDEYDAVHRIWKIADPAAIVAIQSQMVGKKLLIADGHHRYETALGFHADHPEIPGAVNVMMTFVNMHAPGLRILATHRVVPKLEGFALGPLLDRAASAFTVTRIADLDALKAVFQTPDPATVRIGIATHDAADYVLLSRERKDGELDVPVLHDEILKGMLGVSEDAVRHELLRYIRGLDAAVDEVRKGAAVAFLLDPTPADEMARIAFAGGVMPQKSTDFYPKLLTGMAIYKIDE